MTMTDTGLVGPAHHGPGPATDAPPRPTRKPIAMWDRIKFLLLLLVLFWWFVWSAMADNPLVSFSDALSMTLTTKWWIFVVGGLELLRQLHYFISERSPGYHGWWLNRYARFESRTAKFNDWNRFRIARVLKILLFLAILSLVLAAIFDVPPATALFELPARLFMILPFVLQLAFGFFFVMFQFIGLFWFLSRGGIDVYFPEDIKTRFSDVWGQDHVVERVKENLVFLEDPDAIEAKGGYVPGGLLLYGPPGTGKTLMAEAVAGETGKPFVFVEPGAFINMFMGVGILKVKGLFRKLRRLALRYGGVVVFFDEADALGNRGGSGGMQPGPAGSSPWNQTCNGLHYLSARGAEDVWRMPGVTASDAAGPKRDNIIMGGMGGGGGGMGTLQALLTELSGLKKPRGFINRTVKRWLNMKPKPPPKYRILTMMATNRPDVLDEALLRPGRIDRQYRVGYPSTDGRQRTFEGYLSKVKHNLTPEQIHRMAVTSPYATGATIKDMVNEALVMAIRDDRDTIIWADIIRAKQLKTHGPADDQKYTDWEGHAVAVHEACHAVSAYRLRKRDAIDVGDDRAARRHRWLRGLGAARGPVRRLALRPRVRRHGLTGVARRRAPLLRRRQLLGRRQRPPQRHRGRVDDGGVPRHGRDHRLARRDRGVDRWTRPDGRGRHRPPVPRDRDGTPGGGQPPTPVRPGHRAPRRRPQPCARRRPCARDTQDHLGRGRGRHHRGTPGPTRRRRLVPRRRSRR